MEHPYRRALVPIEPARALLVEQERSPRRCIGVRSWSDGTTRLRLRSSLPAAYKIAYLALMAMLAAIAFTATNTWIALLGAAWCATIALRWFGGEEIVVTPLALSRRRRLSRTDVVPLSDVSTVIVTGDGRAARLELQSGGERLPLADGLGYAEAELRWIAQRRRRAIETAR